MRSEDVHVDQADRPAGVERRSGRDRSPPEGVALEKKMMLQMSGLDELRTDGRMTWMEGESGWIAAPEEIVKALASEGFEECKREMTTSRRDGRPAGGVWQGLNIRTGSVASAIWVNRAAWPEAIVFITVDGESLKGVGVPSAARDPYREDGGEA